MKKKLSFFFATLFYSGYFPKAPGTFGSLISLLLIIPTIYIWGLTGLFILCTFSIIIGVLSTSEVLKHTEHDPKFVVIDELAGQAITFLPFAFILEASSAYKFFSSNLLLPISIFIVGFILFRFFDITKPSLVGYFDKKLESTAGVMLDDIAAGVFAAILLTIYIYLLSEGIA